MRRLALVPFLTLALLGGLLPLTAPSARAACAQPSGGSLAPLPDPEGQFVVRGRGWGHGVGMSQYGALGASLLGCTAEDILRTYYQGADVVTHDVEGQVVVGLVAGADLITVQAVAGDVPWQVETPGGIDVVQPEGATWRVEWMRDEERYRLVDQGDGEEVWSGGDETGRLYAQLGNDATRRIALPAKGNRQYAHGDLEFLGRSGGNPMSVSVRLPRTNQYLYGLAEMPSSWPAEALKAQAITGRSYAAVKRAKGIQDTCRCHLVDTPADQVYAGYDKESEPTYGRRWVEAVDATQNRVLWHDNGIATGFYSSSHGGHSESNAFSGFFNSPPVAYLRPVDDSRWEQEAADQGYVRPNKNNPNDSVHAWARAYSQAEMSAALGDLPVDNEDGATIGDVLWIETPGPKGAGGRVGVPERGAGGVVIGGVNGVARISGLAFLNKLAAANLPVPRRSEMFEVQVGEVEDGITTRSSGRGRIETAVQISADHWDAAEDVVLATAGGRDEGYADALSAAALAGRLDAPLLLTGSREVAGVVLQELARLQAQRVHLMGGPAALSPAVEETLVAAGYEVRRVSGEHRFATARAAALAAGPSPTGDVAVALGTNWPDAVSAGTLAASADRVPTLLTLSQEVPEVTLQALRDLQAKRVLLIGGPGVVSEAVAEALRGQGFEVERLSGRTRFATSVAVVEHALKRTDGSARPVIVASGAAFPDALAAGALGARITAPIVLVPQQTLADVPDTRALLRDGPFDRGVVVGGTSAVSSLVRTQLADDLR